MKSLKDFNYLLSLDRRYTKTESEIFRALRLHAAADCPSICCTGQVEAAVEAQNMTRRKRAIGFAALL